MMMTTLMIWEPTVEDFVVPPPHVQTALPVWTKPNLNWRVPPSSASSSAAAAAAQPAVPVIPMRGVQRSQEQHLSDGNPNAEDICCHHQQQQNGGE